MFLGSIAVNTLPPSTAPKLYTPLILISLDGFRNDYLYRGLTPTMLKLANNGIKADYLKSVFPSVTFANHYSIATGLFPESHGIVANQFFDPANIMSEFDYHSNTSNRDSKWWGGEPVNNLPVLL